jgi:hypothetical protein
LLVRGGTARFVFCCLDKVAVVMLSRRFGAAIAPGLFHGFSSRSRRTAGERAGFR